MKNQFTDLAADVFVSQYNFFLFILLINNKTVHLKTKFLLSPVIFDLTQQVLRFLFIFFFLHRLFQYYYYFHLVLVWKIIIPPHPTHTSRHHTPLDRRLFGCFSSATPVHCQRTDRQSSRSHHLSLTQTVGNAKRSMVIVCFWCFYKVFTDLVAHCCHFLWKQWVLRLFIRWCLLYCSPIIGSYQLLFISFNSVIHRCVFPVTAAIAFRVMECEERDESPWRRWKEVI